jgi:hypothetical protein
VRISTEPTPEIGALLEDAFKGHYLKRYQVSFQTVFFIQFSPLAINAIPYIANLDDSILILAVASLHLVFHLE